MPSRAIGSKSRRSKRMRDERKDSTNGGRRQQKPIVYRSSASDAGPVWLITKRVATIAAPTRIPLDAAAATGKSFVIIPCSSLRNGTNSRRTELYQGV